MSSITSKPDKEKFGIASFSAMLFAVEFNKTDASQPCKFSLNYIGLNEIFIAMLMPMSVNASEVLVWDKS